MSSAIACLPAGQALPPIPREVRLSWRVYLRIALLLGFGVLAPTLGLFCLVGGGWSWDKLTEWFTGRTRPVLRGDTFDALNREGKLVEGRVTDVSSLLGLAGKAEDGSSRFAVSYEYRVDGGLYTGKYNDHGNPPKIGDTLRLTYLPSDPKQHRLGSPEPSNQSDQNASSPAKAVQVLLVVGGVTGGLVLLFIVIPYTFWVRWHRRLAREGLLGEGQVLGIQPVKSGVVVNYEFAGKTWAAHLYSRTAKSLQPGGRVAILYNPAKPRRHDLLVSILRNVVIG